jgi:Zn-dependent protease
MLLGEPARTPYDVTFPLLGVPVRIHPFFWLTALLTTYQEKAPMAILAWIAAVFLAILVHESGHALAMRTFGYRPWIILYALGGLTSYDPRGDNRSRRYDSLEHILISAAGPAIGFLLAAALVGAIFAAGCGDRLVFVGPWRLLPQLQLPMSPRYSVFLTLLIDDVLFISVFWGLINLLPIYPLDGGQIAREIFLKMRLRDGIRHSLLLSIVAAAAMTLYGLQQRNYFAAILFASLAYESYTALQSFGAHDRW